MFMPFNFPRCVRPAGLLALLTVSLFSTIHAAQAQVLYSLDDGTADNSLGVTGGGTLTFGNQFTVVPGGETITSVSIAWGTPAFGGIANGTPITAKLWSDPNGDGQPDDSILLSSVNGVTSQAGANTFITYDFPDVTFLPGQSFFVGATITHNNNEFPAAFDTNPPISNHSFAAVGTNFNSGAINIGTAFGGDFLVRANGVSSVPEPGSVALLLGMGTAGSLFAVSRLRRRI
jgi:hypothetical protein